MIMPFRGYMLYNFNSFRNSFSFFDYYFLELHIDKKNVIIKDSCKKSKKNGVTMRKFTIQVQQETDGTWMSTVNEITDVLVYGITQKEAISKAKALALKLVAEQLENNETGSDFTSLSFEVQE